MALSYRRNEATVMIDVLVLAEVGVKAWKQRICMWTVCLYIADQDNSIP